MEQVNAEILFPTMVYRIEKPEFLEAVKTVCMEQLEKVKAEKKLNDVYPVHMTGNINFDPRVLDFANFVAQVGWDILADQGYNVKDLGTYFTEMWCQEHYKHSLMEQHVHGAGSQIVGFYFLDCPKDCSRVLFHDPKAGKVQGGVYEENVNTHTPASNIVNFVPKEGSLILTNAWLPHSFTRHMSKKPMRFVHFNISLAPNQATQTTCKSSAEVI